MLDDGRRGGGVFLDGADLVEKTPRDRSTKEPLDSVTRKLVDFCRATWQNHPGQGPARA